MKKIFILFYLAIMSYACNEEYSLDISFEVPTTLSAPSQVQIDVTSMDDIVFSWSGGGANDGAYVTYSVLFDKDGGDFSDPVAVIYSDLGGLRELTMTHASLDAVARNAGIVPETSGNLIWTVETSKGGLSKVMDTSEVITVERGEGIDNIPDVLYLEGSGNETGGASSSVFRIQGEGVYEIYTLVRNDGELSLRGEVNGESYNYSYINNKLSEGEGSFQLEAGVYPYRITVDFNTLSVKAEVISGVKCIWGANFAEIGVLSYVNDGKFSANNCSVLFLDPDVPESGAPDWLTWVENRYYFIATVDGQEVCWGRRDDVSPEAPIGDESLEFYEIEEFAWSQWDHLWKMSQDYNGKNISIIIDTNRENLMMHEFSIVE